MLVSVYFLLWLATVAMLIWLVFGLPLWLVLGTICWFANRRSHLMPPGLDESGPARAPEVTRFARPAMVVALSIIGAICSYTLLTVPWTGFSDGPAYRALYVVMGVLALSVPVLLTVLAVLFAVVIVDLIRKNRVAGRDTLIAYGTVVTLQSVALGLALASGLFGSGGLAF